MTIDHLVTSGTFSLDGGTWDVDNNVWIVGDDREVIVIDAAHDADAIAAAVGDRRVTAIVCTHGHDDHIDAAPALADRFGAPILLNPAEAPLWDMKWLDRKPDGEIPAEITAGGITLRSLVTPGHSPGSTCLYAPDLGTVFTGDTLFNGGPRRDRAVVLVVRHDHRLDPLDPAHAASGDDRPHRPRRQDEHRRRGPALGGVDRARPMTGPHRPLGARIGAPMPVRTPRCMCELRRG